MLAVNGGTKVFPHGVVTRKLRLARLAVAAIFFVNGAAFASWVVRIPAIQRELGIGTGVLGIALLGVATGALLSMMITGALVARFGSAPVTQTSALLYCAALNLPALAPNPALLLAFLALFGAANGALDISMNAQAVTVEKCYRRPSMSSFHAMFSVGGLVGSVAGGAAASLGVGPEMHLLSAALLLGMICAVALPRLLPANIEAGQGVDSGTGGLRFIRPNRMLATLGLISFCVLFGEGAMADWSAVYLRDAMGAGSWLSAAGYAAFSAAMIAGRLSGDFLVSRLGSVMLVRLGGTLAALGFGVALVGSDAIAALVGFACAGVGFSVVFPVTLSAAGRTRGTTPGPAIAMVSTTGYLGFLVGPPLIGFLGELIGLSGALCLVVFTSMTIAALASTVGQPDAREVGDIGEIRNCRKYLNAPSSTTSTPTGDQVDQR